MGISTMFDQGFGDEIGSNSSKECAIYSKNKPIRRHRYLNARLSTWNTVPSMTLFIHISRC